MNKLLIALVAVLSFSSFVQAQGNIEAGKSKSAACAACHGDDGNSPSNLYPKLAGQHATYLEKQLQQFKNGERANAIMAGMSAALSEQDMQDLAAYYANNTADPETVSSEIAALGQKLYMGGDLDRKMAACTACHGPRGNGLELAKFPKISSQHPAYIKAQLENFRSKVRANDPNGMMSDVASKLSDADIELLANYIGALH
ncbi:MAG: cytochrome c553 [Psychromonas sp.]|jgi:cytochrome c553|uniref:c-type cytochrome n=1 Tax=Psychromonas sp. TaxID=1884585 RepID=UPI0039E424E0